MASVNDRTNWSEVKASYSAPTLFARRALAKVKGVNGQFGVPAELPNVKHRKDYEAVLKNLPAFRITCFFVDREYRRKGVAGAALRGALELIARAGGGRVEAYPQDTGGKKISASFLYSVTRSHFEQAGFRYERPIGKNHCVMKRTVKARAQ